jgi:hypothetical protein
VELIPMVVIDPDRDFGDMPLFALTAGDFCGPPAEPPPEAAGVKSPWRRSRREIAALSTRRAA